MKGDKSSGKTKNANNRLAIKKSGKAAKDPNKPKMPIGKDGGAKWKSMSDSVRTGGGCKSGTGLEFQTTELVCTYMSCGHECSAEVDRLVQAVGEPWDFKRVIGQTGKNDKRPLQEVYGAQV